MRHLIKKPLTGLAGLLLGLTFSPWLAAETEAGMPRADQPAAAAPESAVDEEATQRRCLSLNQIRRIEIIDDQTLKFHMRGSGPDYLNHLPYRCSGLRNRGAFMHATSTSDYCDLDIITQIDTGIGMRLGSCPLGRFTAVEREVESP